MQITIFYIPVGDKIAAALLGNLVIEKKLAGCVNIFPVQSSFPWNDVITNEEEYILLLKTTNSLKAALSDFISANHPYAVPCIMSWGVEVNDEYGAWIAKNVNQ